MIPEKSDTWTPEEREAFIQATADEMERRFEAAGVEDAATGDTTRATFVVAPLLRDRRRDPPVAHPDDE